jgi:hypothetical protein
MTEPHEPTPQPTSGRNGWTLPVSPRVAIIAGVGLGIVVLVLLGLMLALRAPTTSDSGHGRPGLNIAHRPAPEPVIVPGSKMDVLEGAADSFQGVPERSEPDSVSVGDWVSGAEVETYRPITPPARDIIKPEVTPPAAAQRETRRYRSDGREDCTYARTRAEAMVCRDARLSAIDDELATAFASAMRRADDPRRVMRDQQRWERAREAASIDGPDAVEQVYRQRLAELDF